MPKERRGGERKEEGTSEEPCGTEESETFNGNKKGNGRGLNGCFEVTRFVSRSMDGGKLSSYIIFSLLIFCKDCEDISFVV